MKTFIKWPGNKSKHLRHILPLVPEFTGRYIEPFVGSGALFLKLEPEKWIINDLNKDVIGMYKLVRDYPELIVDEFMEFGKMFVGMSHTEKNKSCKKLTSGLDEMEYDKYRSCTYLLLLQCAYYPNLIIKGEFKFHGIGPNILRGLYAFLNDRFFINIQNSSDFLNSKSGKIYNQDYKKILKKCKEGDFVFLDPPYIESHDYRFKYNKGEVLDQEFLDTLVLQCHSLTARNVKWLMTQADTPQVREAFQDYTITHFEAFRLAKKESVKELIITNYA